MEDYYSLELMSPRGRIAVYLPQEIQAALEKWAEEESRSLSGLATYLLTQAVKEREGQSGKDDSPARGKEDK